MILRLLALLLVSTTATTQPAPIILKQGESTVVFTQRSPLSEYSKLLDRLNTPTKDNGPDYELAKHSFNVYVPRDDPVGKPPGLMVCVDATGFMRGLYPVWEAHHLIFISPENGNLPDTITLGLTLDAVYNIQRSRTIDPNRIYLMGYRWGEVMGFCTGDVFTGDMYFWAIGYFRRVDGGRHYIPGTFYGPKPEYLRYATTRPQALGFEDERDEGHEAYHNLVMAGMNQDGFQHVFKFWVPFGSLPQPEDVDRLLKALESSPPTTQPAVQIVPAPANEADHLLKLAQMYIDNQQPDAARDKLNQIIQQYPSDPAAQKAQDLLNQMQAQ
jgi:hypothetical protein